MFGMPLAMGKSRLTSWVLVPVVFVISVVGLFFTVTDQSSWPTKTLQLSASDMRLAPRVSTVWCESVTLTSDHQFVAYQLTEKPKINPAKLSRNTIDVNVKLNSGRYNRLELKYFLLPGSVVTVFSCASTPGVKLYIFKDGSGSSDCFQVPSKTVDSSEYYSDEDSKEDDGIFAEKEKICPVPLKIQDVPVIPYGRLSRSCEISSALLNLNVTMPDNYVIAVVNNNIHLASNVLLQLNLDRTIYTFQKSDGAIYMCSVSTACTVPLSFASKERALVWIPPEQEAGRTSFTIYAQCRPRVEMFALLSVLLPVVLLVLIGFVIRFDRKKLKQQQCRNDISHRRITNVETAHAVPLLVDEDIRRSRSENPAEQGISNSVPTADGQPPPYDLLYDLPPPYGSLNSQPKADE